MTTNFTERRRHIRVYFNELDEVRCLFVTEGKETPEIPAVVVDLSLGGMHLSVEEDSSFNPGDRLTLTVLGRRGGIVCEERVPMEIRWVFVLPGFKRFYMGCQFLALPEASQAFISDMVAEKLRQRSIDREDPANAR